MPSPSSCARCSLPLPADSGERLCPVCLSVSDTFGLPPATPESIDPAARDAAIAVPAVAPPPVTETGTFPESDFRAALPTAPPGYELLRELGHGGMGDVFLAREQATERTVAMKFLRSRGNPVAVDRFLTEVRALARVEHDNIVKVLATDFQRADPFFTMPCVPGGSLAGRVEEKGPLDPREAAGLMAAVARAVQAAHEAGVLHRDLKPSNILLAADGSPRVTDFGLAKLTDRDGVTDPGGALGTPGFMPPEQVSPRYGAVGPASDVYGLGATLYYLVTGRAPFVGDTKEEVITQVVRALPDRLGAVRADVPSGLDAVVLRCLEKNPADRYPTAADLADALDRCAAPVPPPPPRLWRLRRWAKHNRVRLAAGTAGALVGAGLVAAVAAAWPGQNPARPGPPGPAAAPILPATPAVLPGLVPALTHEQARDALIRGERVTLVGETARVPLGWGLGACAVVEPERPGTRFSLRSRGLTVAELLPDPGVERYVVRAELRQDLKTPLTGPNPTSPAARVGLVIGHARVATGKSSVAHAMLLVGFQEPDPGGRAEPVGVNDYVLLEEPLRPPVNSHHLGVAVPLAPAAGGEPPWRVLEVEVRPDGIVIRHDGRSAFCPVGEIHRLLADRENRVRLTRPGGADLGLPKWHPRLPLGIWVSDSWVSIRNVTVEPLP